MVVYRLDAAGHLSRLGLLVPVRSDGFVMHAESGEALYSPGLPWWLLDMRPQGYLGRTYVARHGTALGLPARLRDWSDTDALRALLAHGHDPVGNLLLGDGARGQFIATPVTKPVSTADKPDTYMRLAREVSKGEAPGSSVAGDQPKFTAWAVTADGPRHVLVKFSEVEPGPVSQRWRDLLLAEHLALQTLAGAGVPAARTALLDAGGFLARAQRERGFSRRFAPCLAALVRHQHAAGDGVARLG